VASAYGHLATSSWLATAIGGLLVLLSVLIRIAIMVLLRLHRRRRTITEHLPATATPIPQRRSGPRTADTPSSDPPATATRPRSSRGGPRGQRDPSVPLIAEALVVKQRLAGHIDATTYQQRMHEFTCGARLDPRRP